MIIISLLIPVALAGLFFYIERDWKFSLMIGIPGILVVLSTRELTRLSGSWTTEYLGSHVKSVTHYDDWDEWVVEYRTRTDSKGKTETYTVEYRQYHPEEWEIETEPIGMGWSSSISEEEFEYYRERFGGPGEFIDMHRHYYRKDGDAQKYSWPGTKETAETVTFSETYKNVAQNPRAYSIFGFSEVQDKRGLYEYPKIKKRDQDPVLGWRDPELSRELKWLNGFYGPKYQIRVFFLVWKGEGPEISERQKDLWKGGNKNEFVVCLGLDKKGNKVLWCNPFSWSDEPVLEVETRAWFLKNGMKPKMYVQWLEKEIPRVWKRKEFKDFDYIVLPVPEWGEWLALFLGFLVSGCIIIAIQEKRSRRLNVFYG